MSSKIDVAESSTGGSKGAAIDKKLCVLIVDDAMGIRMMHNMLLKSFGPHVETHLAENGKAAVDLCRSGKYFDVIFMDRDMPVMDGIQATMVLREMGVTSMIVGITSCDLDYEVKPFMEAGLDECLKKPLNRVKVESILKKLHRDG